MDSETAWLLLSLAIGSVGLGLFVYGKSQSRLPHMVIGVVLMGYPYFLSDLLSTFAIAVALLILLRLTTRWTDW